MDAFGHFVFNGIFANIYVQIPLIVLNFFIETISRHKYRLTAYPRLVLFFLFMSTFLWWGESFAVYGNYQIMLVSMFICAVLISVLNARADKIHARDYALLKNPDAITALGSSPQATRSNLRYLIPAALAIPITAVVTSRRSIASLSNSPDTLAFIIIALFVFSAGALIVDIVFGVSRWHNKARPFLLTLAALTLAYIQFNPDIPFLY